MFLVITCKENYPTTVEIYNRRDEAMSFILTLAELNGYIDEGDEARTTEALREELEEFGCYEDGDYTVTLFDATS